MTSNIVIDLTNYKDRFGGFVPADTYRVIVEDAELATSKAGNPMINLWFRITQGDYKDVTLTDRVTLSDKAMFRVVAFMQAVNLPTPKQRLNLNLNTLIGRTLEITTTEDEYNGQMRTNVASYIAIRGAVNNSADDFDDMPDDVEEDAAAEAPAEVEAAPAKKAEPAPEPAPVDVVTDEDGAVDLDSLEDI